MTDPHITEALTRLPQAVQALQQATGDIPPAGGTGATTGPSDRTGRLATTHLTDPRTDPARSDLEHLDRMLAKPHPRHLPHIADIINRWAPNRTRKAAIDANNRAAANDDLNRRGDPNNCPSCARINTWGDIHARGLCRRCDHTLTRITDLYDTQLDMPPRDLLERTQGRKITNGDIHNTMHGQPRRKP